MSDLLQLPSAKKLLLLTYILSLGYTVFASFIKNQFLRIGNQASFIVIFVCNSFQTITLVIAIYLLEYEKVSFRVMDRSTHDCLK